MEYLTDRHKSHIPFLMAVGIVIFFKIVDIQHGNTHIFSRFPPIICNGTVQAAAVHNSAEIIRIHQLLQMLIFFFQISLLFRCVMKLQLGQQSGAVMFLFHIFNGRHDPVIFLQGFQLPVPGFKGFTISHDQLLQLFPGFDFIFLIYIRQQLQYLIGIRLIPDGKQHLAYRRENLMNQQFILNHLL